MILIVGLAILLPWLSSIQKASIVMGMNLNIGALVDFDSSIGPSVRESIQLAVSDINKLLLPNPNPNPNSSDPHLNHHHHHHHHHNPFSENSANDGSSSATANSNHHHSSNDSLSDRIILHMFNSNDDAFQSAAAAMELLKQEVVGIVGPQSTTGSHFIAHMCTSLQVPLVSFGATDPALSEHQYPFFLRLAHNDIYQMRAIADIIRYYGWRTVVALYTDNDYGTNGITALEDALMEQVSPSMFRKERLAPSIDRNGIGRILSRLAMMESRIFVVHTSQEDMGMKVFEEAEYLGMLNTGFVWIVTDLVTSKLEEMVRSDVRVARAMQGVIGMRRYIEETSKLKELRAEWAGRTNITTGAPSMDLNVYAMCAYDAVWLIFEAVRGYLGKGSVLTFEGQDWDGVKSSGATSELAKLRVLKQGRELREEMVQMKFNGSLGKVQLDQKGDIRSVCFEMVNVVGRGMRAIGYWHNFLGLTSLPPSPLLFDTIHADDQNTNVFVNKWNGQVKLPDVLWPGGSTQVPRGWVIPQNGRPLKIGVPRRAGYKELIRQTTDTHTNVTTFHGFCINVFEDAIRYLPYAVTYEFIMTTGNENDTPVYDNLIARLANQEFDAVVGDATITKKRLDLVDFTQPYIESGLEIIVPLISKRPNNEWAFLQPFTPTLWITIGAFFLFTGLVIWMLEHKTNYAFRGRFRKQIVTSLWFIFSTLFFAQREKTKSVLGRGVLIIWLFVVLIITSSYTASLTSILTVQQLSPSMLGIHSLLATNDPIGYQSGSFVKEYLIELGVKPERLVSLDTKAMYAKALRLGPTNGGVAAIVDELPYVQLFLASQRSNEFTTAGQEFTKSGWAFAFPKNSQLTSDMSAAILRMSENGELQKIHSLWFNNQESAPKDADVDSSQLDLKPFSGLFLITGSISTFCLIVYVIRLLKQFLRSRAWNGSNLSASSSLSRSAQFIKSFALYIDEPIDRNTPSRKDSEETAVGHVLERSPVSSLERDT